MYYVTVGPVVLLAVYFSVRIIEFKLNAAMTISCLFLTVLQTVIFARTFTGKFNSKLAVLVSYLIPVFFAMDSNFRSYFNLYARRATALVITDLCTWLCVVAIILAAKKMPEWQEGDPYRRKYGDRMDGRRVYNLCSQVKLIPYFMLNRVGAQNFIIDKLDITKAEHYIHEKRREGLKHFGYTHLFLAAYARCVAEFPALNRFIAGNKIYNRFEIICSMVVKKEMSVESPDTSIKIRLNSADTSKDVYEKYDSLVQSVKDTEEMNTYFDVWSQVLEKIPSLVLVAVISLFRFLDYFGLLPIEAMEASPFHGSMFITSMGSLGIPPIYHHLYDFGNVSQFCAFGSKYTEKIVNPDGSTTNRKYMDFTWVTDERVCDGFTYAAVLKRMRSILLHPEVLDTPPEEVKKDVD